MYSDGRSQAVANRPNAAPPYEADLPEMKLPYCAYCVRANL